MRKYRLIITLFVSFSLHALLLAYLIIHQKNLGFKKGIGEQRIKASFKTLSQIPQESIGSPLKPQPLPKAKTPPTKPKEAPKQTQKKNEEKTEQTPKEIAQEFKEEAKQEEIPQEEPTQELIAQEQTPNEFPPLEQSLQEPLEEFSQSQEQTPPIPYKQSLAYQFADTYTKKNISEIYGPEFGELGKEEQDFIINNLSYIGRITQSYLRYPANAGMLKQAGMNVVEFYLHPNGDISDLKIIKPSGFILLDRNSTKTIEIAYKDYPHPKVKTLIRFYISYIMKPY